MSLATALLMGACGMTAAAQSQIYLVGAPSNWDINGDSMPLTETSAGSGVYSATYNIEAGEFMFRFYSVLGDWNANSIGSQTDDNPISITLTDGKYSGSYVDGKGSWKVEPWAGGDVTMTVDTNNKTVEFVGNQKIEFPEKLYVVGDLNGWNNTSTNTDVLTSTAEGVYEGSFSIDASKFMFRFFNTVNGNWDDTSYQYGAKQYDGDNLSIIMAENGYTGNIVFAGKGNWSCPTWPGGTVNMKVDLNNASVNFTSDVTAYPEVFYITGNFENWTGGGNEEYALKGENGVYSGSFSHITYDGEDLQFKLTGGSWGNMEVANQNNDSFNIYSGYSFSPGASFTEKNNFTVGNWVNGNTLNVVFDLNNMTLTLSSPEAPLPESLRLAGQFNGWSTSDETYLLTKSTDEEGIYTGTFDFDANADLNFKIVFDNTWNYDFGGPNFALFSNIENNVDLVFKTTENLYCTNWQGGSLGVTVDYVNKTATFAAPDQPKLNPATLHLTGNFNDWNTSDTTYTLEPVEGQDGVYQGSFKIEADDLNFKIMTGDSWDDTNYGGDNFMIYAGETYKANLVTPTNDNLVVPFWTNGGTMNITVDINVPSFEMTAPDQPEKENALYLIGKPQGWLINDGSMKLLPSEDDENVYEGTFEIAENMFDFRFYKELYFWDTNSLGSQVNDEAVTITLTDNEYTGPVVEGKGSWEVENWEGGKVQISVDLANNTVNFVKIEEIVKEDLLYLIGTPQGWNINLGSMVLNPTAEGSGVYTATFDLEEGDVEFRFYTQLGAWDAEYSIGASTETFTQVPVEFVSGIYNSPFVYGEGNWMIENWRGGSVTMTVDTNNSTVKFEDDYTVAVDSVVSNNNIVYSNGIISANGAAEISVIDAAGKLVAKTKGESLDITNLSKGIYVIVVPGMNSVKIVK